MDAVTHPDVRPLFNTSPAGNPPSHRKDERGLALHQNHAVFWVLDGISKLYCLADAGVPGATIKVWGFWTLQREACVRGVAVKHFYGFERIVVQVFADQRQLMQQIIGRRDNVAADGVCLKNIQ